MTEEERETDQTGGAPPSAVMGLFRGLPPDAGSGPHGKRGFQPLSGRLRVPSLICPAFKLSPRIRGAFVPRFFSAVHKIRLSSPRI
ncbi:hypothetical protein B4135_3307 [Caldibacillus debilis]|uniref:Uncharacterized protein n=1 Tax=Caldibacillus debilis TaxID=301148 RepID=A0A150LHH8_9BACI|nr:hypothetical protein B4135_3307 [Caldibacillus debilis]